MTILDHAPANRAPAAAPRDRADERTRTVEPPRTSAAPSENGGYGPLQPAPDLTTGLPLLALPEGFEYVSFGHASTNADVPGRLRRGSDGRPTPDRPEGMGTFPTDDGQVRLVRNHAGVRSSVSGDLRYSYDRRAGGATTTLTFDVERFAVLDSFVSMTGTCASRAGGPTPWGNWLACEQTVDGPHSGFEREHGYVFEVPAFGGVVRSPRPHRQLGRFAHSGVAVDPVTGTVYQTEDSGGASGFYRFLPRVPRDLGAGGRLQMLAVRDRPHLSPYDGTGAIGRALPVEWVDIPDPDPLVDNGGQNASGAQAVFGQGRHRGAAAFPRLTACWYDRGKVFLLAARDDGLREQVWEYRPRGSTGHLVLLSASPSEQFSRAPHSVAVTPRGGLLLCGRRGDEPLVRGLDERGELFDLVAAGGGSGGGAGFAGACFSLDGDVLFLNLRSPGATVAIRGPWERGAV